jgi:DNA invertase Pin-like site-specific DNA recombinase
MPRHSTSPTAYSYVRFSTPEQAKGDSLRRQTEKAEDYCRRKGLTLDASLTLHDLGVSAFRGDNAVFGNLRTFLDAVGRRRVAPGSVLIVESFDRITRQGIDDGYDLIKRILKADVRIVTLSPEREFDRDATRSLSKGALEIQLILERAAEESERKSERVGGAWAEKRKRLRDGEFQTATRRMGEGSRVLTHRLPAWVEERNGKATLVPAAAKAVRRVFQLAAAGYGVPSIIRTLTREGVPAIGRSGSWTRSYLALLLRDRRAMGEYQPRTGGKKDGGAIPDYYPAVVSEDEWHAARAGVRERSRYRGRSGASQVNVFSGLLKNARDGDSYMMTGRLSRSPTKETTYYRVLVNSDGDQGKARAYSVPYLPFEKAVLSCLREIDPHDILNGDTEGPDETQALSGELTEVETELAEAKAFMNARGFSAAIGERITLLEARQRDLAARLAEARHKAAHPLSETWGEFQSLAAALEAAPDPEDFRLRLRSSLRRIAEGMSLLVVPRGKVRLAAVQIDFTGGRRRSYLIYYRPAQRPGGRPIPPALWWRSLVEVAKSGDLDLRQQDHVEKLMAVLESTPLSAD